MTGLTSPARARGWPAKMVWIFQAPTLHGVLGGGLGLANGWQTGRAPLPRARLSVRCSAVLPVVQTGCNLV
ncbi:hypothetical protein AD947_09280 [Acetobacter tropicalis]|uniref:Uncharacterized protein n=2 Tax=Acetobacter tropicalis TaxID=104102 RepID=A0A149TVK7_9PROT|nr:hypothetical protein AD947_09280 [Acetobacter tropicalis]